MLLNDNVKSKFIQKNISRINNIKRICICIDPTQDEATLTAEYQDSINFSRSNRRSAL